jgi:hypothetical protein
MVRILHGAVVEYRPKPFSMNLGLDASLKLLSIAFAAVSYSEALGCSNSAINGGYPVTVPPPIN